MTANNFDKHTLVWRNDPTAPQEEFILLFDDVGTQGAAYGGTNALRTVTAFYPAVANDVRSGLVASVRHEDGKLDVYDYSLVSNLWVETVTRLHEQSPAPVSGKTTRDITLTNARGGAYRVRPDCHSRLPQ